MNTWRNRVAWWLCEWVMAHVADERYQSFISGAVRYGVYAAARDELNAAEYAVLDTDWDEFDEH